MPARDDTRTHFERRLQERCQVSDDLLAGAVSFLYSQMINGKACYLYESEDGTEVHAVRLFHTVIPVRWDPRVRSLVSALPIIALYNKQLTREAHGRLGDFMVEAHASWLTRPTRA